MQAEAITGWAADVIEGQARNFNRTIQSRDLCKQRFELTKQGVDCRRPEDLKRFRKLIRAAQKALDTYNKRADLASENYLAVWDLLTKPTYEAGLGILKGDLYRDPTQFRLAIRDDDEKVKVSPPWEHERDNK
jgi:hypothetical protein